MKKVLACLMFASMLSACYKDDVIIDRLTTNPLDPDYTGPALFTVLTDSTYEPTSGVYEQYLKIRVDGSVLPGGLVYELRIEDQQNGNVTELVQQPIGAHDFEHFRSGVTLGNTYCYAISIQVQEASGRRETYCGVAQL